MGLGKISKSWEKKTAMKSKARCSKQKTERKKAEQKENVQTTSTNSSDRKKTHSCSESWVLCIIAGA